MRWAIGVAALTLLLAPLSASALDDPAPVLSRDRQQALNRQLGHLGPAEQQGCIARSRIAQTIVISDDRILYRFGRNLVYENRPQPSCIGLARSPYEPIIGHNRSLLCAGDIIEVASAGGDICTLGRFTAWRPAPADPANPAPPTGER